MSPKKYTKGYRLFWHTVIFVFEICPLAEKKLLLTCVPDELLPDCSRLLPTCIGLIVTHLLQRNGCQLAASAAAASCLQKPQLQQTCRTRWKNCATLCQNQKEIIMYCKKRQTYYPKYFGSILVYQ